MTVCVCSTENHKYEIASDVERHKKEIARLANEVQQCFRREVEKMKTELQNPQLIFDEQEQQGKANDLIAYRHSQCQSNEHAFSLMPL